MEWSKTRIIGTGSFASVSIGVTGAGDGSRRITAVKSVPGRYVSSLREEKEILDRLRGCPQIVTSIGDDVTLSDRDCHLFLEYVAGGSLADHVKRSGGRLPEIDVRRITASILRGLCFIHANGYVHCDVKLQNILVCSATEVKIADFGVAKRAGDKVAGLRGTPLYMAPESVARSEYEAPADVWSLGWAVSEMITGKPAWSCSGASDVASILFQIGFRDESPEIPYDLSEETRDFLGKCFIRDPAKRWTAEMLMKHAFITGCDRVVTDGSPNLSKQVFESPRSALDFPEWNSPASVSLLPPETKVTSPCECKLSPADRIRELATTQRNLIWASSSSSDGWISVRQVDFPFFPSDAASSLSVTNGDESAPEKTLNVESDEVPERRLPESASGGVSLAGPSGTDHSQYGRCSTREAGLPIDCFCALHGDAADDLCDSYSSPAPLRQRPHSRRSVDVYLISDKIKTDFRCFD